MHDGCAAPGYIQRAQWEGCSQDSLFFFLLQIFSEIIHLTWYESRVRNRICSARSRPRLCLCDPGVRILSEPTLLTHNEEDLHAVAVLLTEDLLKKLFCSSPPLHRTTNPMNQHTTQTIGPFSVCLLLLLLIIIIVIIINIILQV